MASTRKNRLMKEMETLGRSPPPGTSCWCNDKNLSYLKADIIGADESPYAGGIFKIDIEIPDRYPFEPPKVKFQTPIYHPNIDNGGRICLDVLKLPPKGTWKPTYNIATVLSSIQLLMVEPNPNDPLMAEIAEEFMKDKASYVLKAEDWTRKHAMANTLLSSETRAHEVRMESDEALDHVNPTTCKRPLCADGKENKPDKKRSKTDVQD